MELKLVPVTDGLFQVAGRHQGRFPSSHSFLVLDNITALIDTGCGLELLERIREVYRLDLIVNSLPSFLHPKGSDEFPVSGEGVLIELVQAPPEVVAALG